MPVYDPHRNSPAYFDSAVDDEDDPTQLTVFSDRADELPTHWISIDIDHAVALDEMR